MADNTTLNTMTGGDVYRSKDRTTSKTSIVALDLNPSGSETLMAGTMPCTQSGTWNVATVTTLTGITNVVHVDDNSGSLTVDNAGTFATQATLQTGDNTVGRLKLTDGTDVADIVPLGTQVVTTDNGLVVNAVIHGLSTAGGGSYIDVKVNPSGALAVAATQDGTWNVGTVTTITNVVHVDDNSGSLTVDNAGTFAVQATIASGATSIAKAEDVASASADVGVPSMAIRKATPANTSDTDGDYEMLQMSAGRLWCSATIDAALPAGTNAIGKLASNTGVTIGAVEIAAAQTLATVTTVGTVTNVVHVDDNSGSLTVDAPVATPVFVRLSDGAAAISTLPVSLASVPSHAVTNAGTFATQESQIITDNAGFTDGTSKVFPVGYIYDEVAGTALTENDVGAARMNVNRATISCIEDGSTRARYATVTASNALKVDGSAVTQPVSGSLTTVSTVTSVTQFNGVAIALNNGTTSTGTLRVTLSSDSTGIIASIGTSVTPGTSAAHLGKAEDVAAGTGDTGVAVWGVRRDTPTTSVNSAGDYCEIPVSGQGAVWVSNTPSTGGGWSISRLLSAATTNATSAKASAGIVGGWYIYNANAAVRYLKIYNKASAPTVGTDTPVLTIPIPAGAAANVEFTNGINFATGIAYATTTGVADNDTGAVAANEIIVNLFYK